MTDEKLLSGSVVFEPGLVKITAQPHIHPSPMLYHTQEFWELVLVERGFALLGGIGSSTLLSPGDFALIPPHVRHSFVKSESSGVYSCMFMEGETDKHFGELLSTPLFTSLFRKYTAQGKGSDEQRAGFVNLDFSERYEFLRIAGKINDERINKGKCWQLLVRSLLGELLVFCCRLDAGMRRTEQHGGSGAEVSRKVIRYFEENYGKSITPAQAAKELGLGAEQITNQFKNELSVSPSEYLRRYRIAKSMELLCGTDMSVNDVATASGFSDFSAFSRVFKQYEGDTPSGYRKKMKLAGE